MRKTILSLMGIIALTTITSCNDVNNFTFELVYNATEGKVEGTTSGKYAKDYLITLDATANEGYEFKGYYENNSFRSFSEHYEFTLTANTTIEARFIKSEGSGGDIGGEDGGDVGGDIEVPTTKEVPIYTIEPGKSYSGNGEIIPLPNYELKSVDEYYLNIDLTLTKNALKSELKKVSYPKTKKDYGFARYALQYTDESLEDKGFLYGVYNGAPINKIWDSGKTWNREHLWPKSRLKGITDEFAQNDLHNLRASDAKINSERGNNYYSEKGQGGYYPNVTSDLDFRGDVAREMFYMYVTYDGLVLSNDPNNGLNHTMGRLDDLLKWHKEDPVSEFEKQRNMKIYQYQGNRNPFIDIPDLVNNLF